MRFSYERGRVQEADILWTPSRPLSAGSPTVTTPNLLRDSLHIGNLVGEIGTRPGEMMGTEAQACG